MNYLKCITAFVVAVSGGLSIALQDNHITSNEWISALVAGGIALGGVWGIPNIDRKKADE